MKIRTLQSNLIRFFLIIAFFSVGFISIMSLFNAERALKESSLVAFQKETENSARHIEEKMQEYKSDLFLLANTPPVRAMIRAKNSGGIDPVSKDSFDSWKARFLTILQAMMESKKFYQQIRFIYLGREVVRVDFKNGNIQKISNSMLQDKKNYDYFQEALKLKEGGIYTSDLNLNREYGKIQHPHVPVLRFSTPVFVEGVKDPGVVVINVYANSFLDFLQTENEDISLTNQEGFYIQHSDVSKTFAFEEMGKMKKDKQGQYRLSALIRNFGNEESYAHIYKDQVISLQKIHFDENNFDRYWLVTKMASIHEVLSPAKGLKYEILLGVFLFIPFVIFLAIFISRKITLSVSEMVNIANRIAKGEMDFKVETNADTAELKQLEISMQTMQSNLKQTMNAVEAERNKLVDQDWVKTNFVQIMDKLQGIKNLRKLSSNFINALAPVVEAKLGVFYIKKINERGEEYILFLSAYAYDSHQDIPKSFKLGEGLVGQCALEKKVVTVTDVPDNYLKINSGIGGASPRVIAVVPIEFEGELLGVVELASFKEFTSLHYELLEQIRERVGGAIDSLISRQRTEELLKESEALGKELQDQSIKLEESNRELEIKSESLERQKEEIEDKNFSLEEVSREIKMKARDLEDANRYKSEFLANMSHELRTPLNSLLILSKFLSDNEDHNLTPDQVESAKIIHGSGADLLRLINEILDLSKIESGKMDVIFKDTKIQDIVESLRRNFNHVAKDKKIDFEVTVENNLPESISTDGEKAGQVLKNFLANAFKFSDEGGYVKVHIFHPNQDIKFQRKGLERDKVIAFSVADNGIGIPENKQKIIFESFQQADGSTQRKYGGTGLGLSISRKFADILGGEIGVESIEGKGSTFSLYLPESSSEKKEEFFIERRKKPVEMFSPPLEMDSAGHFLERDRDIEAKAPERENLLDIQDDRDDIRPEDKTLLIIEDDLKFLKILLNMARKKGFKCLAASDGESGLKMAKDFKPRAILLDIMLPKIDGWGVMEHLKNDPRTRHIPIHLSSALEESTEAFKKGGIGYLSKPVNKEDLEGAFERIETFIIKKIKNLLVVEGKPETKEKMISLLDSKDMNIVCVRDIQSAYAHLGEHPCDCVILQADTLGPSLFEFLDHIQQKNQLEKLPIIVVHENREFSKEEDQKLKQYAENCVIKNVKSMQRLLDETVLFLHKIEADLPEEQQKTIRMLHDTEFILRDKKILIVDDDMRNTFSLSHVLKHKGVEVLMADNGQKALEVLSEYTDIDLVLMDIMMPVMDGFQAMKEIRKQECFNQLPILALTAKAMKGDREKCIESGASDYLTKPVEIEKLFSMLRVWLYQ